MPQSDLSTVTGEMGEKLQNMRENPAYLSITPVRMKSLQEASLDGKISFSLPGKGQVITLISKQINQKSNGDLDWYGEVEGKTPGWASFKIRSSTFFGNITYDDRSFKVRTLSPGKIILIEVAKTKTIDACSHGKTGKKDNDVVPLKNNCAPLRVIRVLTLYSDAANAIANPVQEAADGIGNLNLAMINSGLNDVRFEGAGVQRYVGFQEDNTGDIFTDSENDLAELTNDLNTAGTAIAQFRDDFNADLVVLLVDGNYTGPIPGNPFFTGTVNGIAGLDPIQADNAYAIVEIDAGDNTVFAHEVGHNLGCRHDNDNTTTDPLIGGFANGQLFNVGINAFKTTNSSGASPGTRILNFSNPDVDFMGVNTGTVNTNDNARQIDDNTACAVSCYQLGGDPMNVFISGLTRVNEGQSATWCANVSDCNNISYNWAYSTNGFSYTPISGSSCKNFTAPSGVSQFFLRVIATCTDGQQAEDVHRVIIQGGNGGGGPIQIGSTTEELESIDSFFGEELSETHFITAYPNPASNLVNIELSSSKDFKELSYFLRDINGKVVFNKNLKGNSYTDFNFKINLEGQEPGIYLLTLYGDGDLLNSKKIMVK